METLVAIADTGSFRAAAARLGLSPAMATTHVKRLEERLGVRLLQRSTRRLALTEQGRTLVEDGRIVLDGLAAAESRAREGRAKPAGRVRIDAPGSLGALALLPALPRLRALYPDIVVELTLGDRGTSFRPDGFDIIVRVGDVPMGDFVTVELGTTRFVLVAAPGFLEGHGVPAGPEALREYFCIVYSSVEAPGGRPWRLGRDGDVRWLRVPPVAAFNDGRAIAEAAMAGLGIAQTLEMLVRGPLADGRLVEVLAGHNHVRAPVMLVSPVERHRLAAVASVMAFLQDEVDWGLA